MKKLFAMTALSLAALAVQAKDIVDTAAAAGLAAAVGLVAAAGGGFVSRSAAATLALAVVSALGAALAPGAALAAGAAFAVALDRPLPNANQASKNAAKPVNAGTTSCELSSTI